MKTKFYKLIFLPVLIIIFTACMGAEPEVVPTFETGGELDFAGYEFTILPEAIHGVEAIVYDPGTLNNERLSQRFSDIENSLNCKINIEYLNWDTYQQQITTAGISGIEIGDIIATVNSNMAMRFAQTGFLLPFSEVSEIVDYENEPEKYGYMSILEVTMFNGEVYKLVPVALPDIIDETFVNCVFAIKEGLVKKYAVTDPREFVENKTWTWENFEKVCNEMTITDAENSYRAFWANKMFFVKNSVLSNGMEYVIEKNGSLVSGITEANVLAGFEWAKKMIDENSHLSYINDSDIWGYGQTVLMGDDVFMAHVSTIHVSKYISKTVDDFGVVPFPCGPDAEYGDWAAEIYCAYGFSVFKNVAEPEGAAYILRELFEPFEGLETVEDRMEHSYRNVYFNNQDADIMASIYKYGRYTYWDFGGDGFWNTAASGLLRQTPAQIIEANAHTIDAIIEEYVIPNYEYMKNVAGG